MNLRQAEYVLAILREGSISAAAKTLFISQPALSQTLRLTEQGLGAPIFKRGVAPLQLTFAGERYVEAARQVIKIDENLRAEIDEINREEHGRLCFGVSRQRGSQLIPAVLPEFSQRYPGVKLELEEHGSETLENMTADGTVDMALATTDTHREKLEYRLVEHERLFLLAGRETRLARNVPPGTEIGIRGAADEAFVSLKRGHSVRNIQDHVFEAEGMHPHILIETDSFDTAMRVAVQCGAVMICPHIYLREGIDARLGGVRYPLCRSGFERHSYLCYRKDTYLPRYMKDWISMIEECAKMQSEEFCGR